METITLEVEDRTVLGKQVKSLRQKGITPANIFGPDTESRSVQSDAAEAEKVLAKAGATHLISLKLPSDKGDRWVLVKKVHRDTITGKLLHIDFHQVRMKDKVKVEVPLVFEGESPASRRSDLVLLESLYSLDVECLPEDIPESITVDLSKLAEADDSLLVGDLTLGDRVTVLTPHEEMVAKVSRAKKVEVVEEVIAAKPEKAPVAEVDS